MAAGQAASIVDRRLLALAHVRTVQGAKWVSAVVQSELWLENRLSNREPGPVRRWCRKSQVVSRLSPYLAAYISSETLYFANHVVSNNRRAWL